MLALRDPMGVRRPAANDTQADHAGGGRDDPPVPAIAVAVKAAYADAARWANEGGSVVAEGAHRNR